MGLAWQQGPLASASAGRFLTPQPMPERILFAEPLRRRMRVSFGDRYIADSEDVVLLHEPGRYPVDGKQGMIENAQVVSAHVPLSEMFGYATDVRSMTQGRATYTMQFDKYEEVPPNIAEKVVEGRTGEPVLA